MGLCSGSALRESANGPAGDAIVASGTDPSTSAILIFYRADFSVGTGSGPGIPVRRTGHPNVSTPSDKPRCWKPLELFCDFRVGEPLSQVSLRAVVAREQSRLRERHLRVKDVEGADSQFKPVP
jgi:hypothetical protein